MIYSITGELILVEPNHIVISTGGVGYSIKTTFTTMANLPQVGEQATVFTYLYVREDLLELFGFSQNSELVSFKQLIAISGVGPKAALSILSDLTPEKFAMCVATGDYKSITKSQGIGPKTAQRIVLELKDKISKQQLTDSVVSGGGTIAQNEPTGNMSEAISALVVLGYSQMEASTIISSLDSSLTVEELIKEGLKQLASK